MAPTSCNVVSYGRAQLTGAACEACRAARSSTWTGRLFTAVRPALLRLTFAAMLSCDRVAFERCVLGTAVSGRRI